MHLMSKIHLEQFFFLSLRINVYLKRKCFFNRNMFIWQILGQTILNIFLINMWHWHPSYSFGSSLSMKYFTYEVLVSLFIHLYFSALWREKYCWVANYYFFLFLQHHLLLQSCINSSKFNLLLCPFHRKL